MPAKGDGTKQKPWELKTPSGLSAFQAYKDETATPPALVVTVGSTTLQYQLRCLDDLHVMLRKHGDWMPLGSADEQKPAAPGTVESWAPDLRPTLLAAGTASKRDSGAGSETTYRPSWRRWGWRKWNTNQRTIE